MGLCTGMRHFLLALSMSWGNMVHNGWPRWRGNTRMSNSQRSWKRDWLSAGPTSADVGPAFTHCLVTGGCHSSCGSCRWNCCRQSGDCETGEHHQPMQRGEEGDSTTEVTLSPQSVCKFGGAFYVAELTVVLYRFDRGVAVRRWQRCCGIDISELTNAFLSWQTRWGIDIPGWQWRCVVDRHVAEFTDSLLSWQTRCWVDSGAAELTDELLNWQTRCGVDRGVAELTVALLLWQWRWGVDRGVVELIDALWSWQWRYWVESGVVELTEALWSW